MLPFTQASRALAVYTPLGIDAVLLEKLSGRDAISELFRFELDLLAPAPIPFEKVLNEWASVRVTAPGGPDRFINGIVHRLVELGTVTAPQPLIRYRATLVPALWRLTLRTQNRIFQHLSVPDILRQILVDVWQMPVVFHLYGTHPVRNYCMQYDETAFAFISRLMEDEGICYYFRHEAQDDHSLDRHVLVVSDNPALTPDDDSSITAHYHPDRDAFGAGRRIWEWETAQEVCTAAYTVQDYHFEVPEQKLRGEVLVRDTADVGGIPRQLRFSYRTGAAELLERAERPCAFAHRFDDIDAGGEEKEAGLEGVFAEGQRIATLRAEAAAAEALVVRGSGDVVEFTPGRVFTIADHFRGNGRYLLFAVECSMSQNYLGGPTETLSAPAYENRFTCLPVDVPFRPQRRTPRPRIDGPQTATVTAPEGEPAFLDKYGRIKVKFHWDLSDTKGADTSCWLRVGQVWAGKRWGAFFWPRPGHEVIVAFEDANPDRPIVVGNVYNAENLPALSPKEHPAANGIKSCSLGRDPLRHFNSLTFYDNPHDEHIHVHSETHEVASSKQTKYADNQGPSIRFAGVLPQPPGSGGGGGWLDYNTLVATSMGMPNPLSLALPGEASYAYGERFEATVGGGRNTHVLGGGDVKLILDPESIAELLVSMVPAVGPILETLAGFGVFGVGGDTGLVVGAKNQSTFGPTLDFRAYRTFQYTFDFDSDYEDDSKPPARGTAETLAVRAIWTLAAMVVTTAVIGDVLARSLARIKESKKEEEKDEKKDKTHDPKKKAENHEEEEKELEVPEWTALIGVALSNRFHALLISLESALADVQRTVKEDGYGGHLINEWAEVGSWIKERPEWIKGKVHDFKDWKGRVSENVSKKPAV